MSPTIPPSCQPWASIEDDKERAEQIRPIMDQLKSAVKQMEAIPEQYMPPETKKQKEDMESQVREMEAYLAELTGEAKATEPDIPPSCLPWASIEDVKERAEQIRPLADQLKSAVKQMEMIPEEFMPPETKQQKQDMENQVHEMETYIAHLLGEEPPAAKEETPEDSADWLVVTNEEGVLDARQEIGGVLLPQSSPIERDEAGHLILPESMAGYEGLVNSGMDAGFIATNLQTTLDAYKNSLEGMVTLPPDDPSKLDMAQNIVDFQAVIDAITSKEKLKDEVTESLHDIGKSIIDQINACEGNTLEEKQHRHLRNNYRDLMQKNPIFEPTKENTRRIANTCLMYCPPNYETTVFHEDGTPYLAHFINNYLDGAEGFAEDLAAGFSQSYNTSDDCAAFRRILEEVAAPSIAGEKTWDEVEKTVFLVCATIGSTSIQFHFAEDKYSSSMSKEELDEHKNDNFYAVKEIASESMKSITAQLKTIEKNMRESGDLKKLASLEFASEAPTTTLRQDNDEALGFHPMFLKHSDFLKRLPCAYPNNALEERLHHLYLTHDEVGLQFIEECLDQDLQGSLNSEIEIQRQARDGVLKSTLLMFKKAYEEIQYFERTTTQPFLYWLIQVCRPVTPVFHDRMRTLFGDKYSGAPVKRLARASAKVKEDYSHFDKEMPSAAHLLDVVRGLVVCSDAEEMCEMYETICNNFEVIRVKNGFVPPESKSGFRQILMNLRFDPKDESVLPKGCAVICEMQLNLESYANVKHQIHLLYQIARCEKPEEVPVILQESAHPF